MPCLTLRDSTERPITVQQGSNTLAGTDPATVFALGTKIIHAGTKSVHRPALWDGQAAQRIVNILARDLGAASPS